MLGLCFPLFLCYFRKSQGSSVLMHVKYPLPEPQQRIPALTHSVLFSSTPAHFNASLLVSQEKRQREYLPTS